VTFYAAGAAGARALDSARTDARGRFAIAFAGPPGGSVLYLVASGGATPCARRAALDERGQPGGAARGLPARQRADHGRIRVVSRAVPPRAERARTIPWASERGRDLPQPGEPRHGRGEVRAGPCPERHLDEHAGDVPHARRHLGALRAGELPAAVQRRPSARRAPARDTLEAVLYILLHAANNVCRIFARPGRRPLAPVWRLPRTDGCCHSSTPRAPQSFVDQVFPEASATRLGRGSACSRISSALMTLSACGT
jgi:hypothetical protein